MSGLIMSDRRWIHRWSRYCRCRCTAWDHDAPSALSAIRRVSRIRLRIACSGAGRAALSDLGSRAGWTGREEGGLGRSVWLPDPQWYRSHTSSVREDGVTVARVGGLSALA